MEKIYEPSIRIRSGFYVADFWGDYLACMKSTGGLEVHSVKKKKSIFNAKNASSIATIYQNWVIEYILLIIDRWFRLHLQTLLLEYKCTISHLLETIKEK